MMSRVLIAALLCALVGCQPTPPPIAAADMSHAPDSHATASADPTHPSAPPPTRPSKDLDIPLLVPGSAIGPFKLGVSYEALVAAGHELELIDLKIPGSTMARSGAYTLSFDEGRALRAIELDLSASGLRLGEHKVSGETPVEELLKVMGCGPFNVLLGGSSADCAGAQLLQAGPVQALSVLVQDAPRLIPGVGIGPFKLGDTQEALVAAGHKLEAHPSGQLGDAVRISGPYTLVFADGAVSSIELALDQAAARYKDQTLTGQDDVAALGKLLDCGPLEILEGGNVATCVKGLQLSQAGPLGLLRVRVSAPR